MEQPTAKAIAATWQELMSNFSGFDVNGDVDEQIQKYCKIRSERYKRAVVGGLQPFIKGNDYAFFMDVLEPLIPKKRQCVLKNVLLRFNKDALAVLNDNQVQKELSARAMQMSKADAILLFYAGNYSEQQWDGMAAAVNKLMDDSTRSRPGFPPAHCARNAMHGHRRPITYRMSSASMRQPGATSECS
jgi:hypothetical protein